MDDRELEQIRLEIEAAFIGRRFGKVFPLSGTSMAIDFHPHNAVYLYINHDPKVRMTYLIRRRLKELERASVHASPFVIGMRRILTGRELTTVNKDQDKKVLGLEFAATVDQERSELLIQIGGKVPNMFIIEKEQIIVAAARGVRNAGQTIGEKYAAPAESDDPDQQVRELNGRTLSDLLDEQSKTRNTADRFNTLAVAARKKINAEISKRRKLLKNLEGDLTSHGDAEQWKRFGDLLLANIANLRRDGDRVIVTDYFDPELADVVIPVEANQSPTEAAENFFRRYAKARNGAAAISKRMIEVRSDISGLEANRARLEAAIEAGDEQTLLDYIPTKKVQPLPGKRRGKNVEFKGARSFVSSDDFEILVGKKAKDNDYLTFRVAKSLDLWLHAADYPGSHVVVRNPNRNEVPVRTLIEAAQLAAFYSDARENPKAAVNYTSKKFVNKPKRAAPGLVSLASFKTILVEPQVGEVKQNKP
ncbi:MAG: NFACT RNA binding domain-containing protein [Pyrinomonadaceae bacterium]